MSQGPATGQRLLSQAPVRESLREVKFRIQSRVIQDLDPKLDLANQVEVRRQIEEIFGRVIDEEGLALTRAERVRMLEQITDEIIGLGPLEPLLRDETVTEIMVNGPRQVYIERSGKLELTNVVFQNDDHVMRIIDRIIAPIGRRIDESSPMVDARLTDGSRVNATRNLTINAAAAKAMAATIQVAHILLPPAPFARTFPRKHLSRTFQV
jgi:pilus assembly protein CpaF